MALSDTYMLRDVQDYGGETILNIYFFTDILLASTAQNLVEAWESGFLPKVAQIQTANVHHNLIDAVNLADPSNFFEKKVTVSGINGVSALPAHDAINYSLRINSRALRPGSKRYCGIGEEFTTDNLITGTLFLTYLEALRVQQSQTLLSGVVQTFKPVVVKRVQYVPDPLHPEKVAYRLPETDAEFVSGDVIDALVALRISHQVSRNNGK